MLAQNIAECLNYSMGSCSWWELCSVLHINSLFSDICFEQSEVCEFNVC